MSPTAAPSLPGGDPAAPPARDPSPPPARLSDTLIYAAAVAGPALILLLFGVLSWLALQRSEASTRAVRHSGDVLVNVERTLSLLRDAETGQRGYLLTGEPRYLEPYHSGMQGLAAQLDSLQAVVADDPVQRPAAAELRRAANRKRTLLDSTVTLHDRYGPAAALALVRTDQGKRAMDHARRVVASMEARERQRLEQEQARERVFRHRLNVTLVVGLLLSTVVAALSNLLFARHAAERRRLADEVEEQNLRLQDQASELELQLEQNQDLNVELEASAEELRNQRDRAELLAADARAANRAKSEFLGSMSHELRTPLNAIAGYADLLDLGIYGALTDQQRGSVERIRAAQGVLLTLIDDLLSFTRIEAGTLTVELEEVPVGPVLAEIEGLVRPQLDVQQIDYSCAPCADGLSVHADPARVRQILLNLLSNALKFTPSGGSVRVVAEAAGAEVRIQVRDSGRGIPAQSLERIFEPFVQLDRHLTAQSQQGVGLGLSIARDLARRMGGELVAENAPGGGAEFVLTLPRAEAASRADGTPG